MAKHDEQQQQAPQALAITPEQLAAMVATASAAAAKAAVGEVLGALGIQAPNKNATPEEQFHAQNAARRGQHLPPLPVEKVPVKSRQTGATFTAVVNHRGIVQELEAYAFPDGIEAHEDEGGLVPRGLPIKDKTGALTVLYKSWRRQNFRLADIRQFIGRRLPEYERADFQKAVATPNVA